jgi:dienelactone hydrolase
MARSLVAMFILTLGAAGCGNSAEGGGPDDLGGGPADMGGYPIWSPASPAICGQPAYTWQPSSKVGSIYEYSKNLLPEPKFFIQGLEVAAFLGSQLNVHHAVSYDVQTSKIRYQTQDRGQLVDATAMVSFPSGASGNSFPVLLFLHPTLGYTDDCAPSKKSGDPTAPMTIFSLIAASAGYIAVFPDYLNQRSLGAASQHVTPYLLMEPTALASLDAVRAAQAYVSSHESLTATNDVYVWGHSQGAQAVEYVTALQPLYAPELTIKAAAAVSPPSDLQASAKANFAGPAPTYNLGEAIAYAWADYYDISQVPTALVSPWDTSAPDELKNYCNTSYNDPIKSVTDPTKVFTAAFLGEFNGDSKTQPWDCWLHYNNPATMDPAMPTNVPLLYVTGEKDTTVIPSANDPVIARWCSQGVPVRYLQCSGADHVHTIAVSVDDVLTFFDNRRAGNGLGTDCQPKPPTKCASTP